MRFRKLYPDVEVYEIPITEMGDEELKEVSAEMSLGLSLKEMKNIASFFREREGRNPTDIELQALGQAWSEHCCYKSSKAILKATIFGIEAPQAILAVKEDAGVVEFDDEWAYVTALESHNHPSAIVPYGGAATGVGGILRDVLCMGAQPIALTDPLFFGPLDYPSNRLPRGVKHPKYITAGVVAGIRDYGNRVGIPTVAGMVAFHPGYVGNPLVNVGCIGMVRKKKIVRSRVGGVGDYFVLAGGRTGRDGIHGVTFASADLTGESEERDVGAVQLGDPIVKEPLMHAVLDINEKGLITGMKDLGGGGLSCVSGEMALAAGLGAEIELDKVLLKEENMAPWEIWVSESQERMMVTTKEGNLAKVLDIFSSWDVEATVIGRATEGKRIRVFWKGKKILDMDLEFQTRGPLYCRPYLAVYKERRAEDQLPPMPEDLNNVFLQMLEDPNLASKEWVVRQYDHEVRGRTILKPLQGDVVRVTHGDASVLKPLEDSYRGLALTTDVNPYLCERDPYWGAASAVDEAVRNLVSVGARPHSFNDCLNFGNPEKPERLGDLREAARGLAHVARALGIPFVSGNVSLYNESEVGAVPPTPTIFAVGIVEDVRRATTADFKEEGNLIYLVGRTHQEMGGSLYYRILGWEGGVVPQVDTDLLRRSTEALLELNRLELLRAVHDLSEGGLAAAAAEMAFGGGVGVQLDLSVIEGGRDDVILFSESNTRWLLEVQPEGTEGLEELLTKHGVPFMRIGRVGGEELLFTRGGRELMRVPLEEAWQRWHSSIYRLVGVGE